MLCLWKVASHCYLISIRILSNVKTKHKNINARIKCGMWDKDLKASARVHMVDIHEAEENNVPCPQCDSMWKSRKRMIHHKIVHN